MSAQINYWIMYVKDTARATEFFGPVMGWTFSDPGSAGGNHVLESDPWGSIAPLPPGVEPSGAVAAAFAPDDIDASLAAVTRQGGTIVSDENGEEYYGRWAECADDQGTHFALFVPAPGVK